MKKKLLIEYLSIPKYVWIIGIILIVFPGFTFIVKFCSPMSENVAAWNNMASYFNDAYTPIFTIITAYAVVKTFINQREANKVSEIATLSIFFKDRFKSYISKLVSKTGNFNRNDFYTHPETCFQISKYKEKLNEYYKAVKGNSELAMAEFNKIRRMLNYYDFKIPPSELFEEEFEIIGEEFLRIKNGFKFFKNHLLRVKDLDEDFYNGFKESLDFKIIKQIEEEIDEIGRSYKIEILLKNG